MINRELVGLAEGNWASVVILGGPSGREYATRDPFDVQPGLDGDQRRCDLRLTKENPFVSRVKVGTFFWWLCCVYLKLELRKRKGPFWSSSTERGGSAQRVLESRLKASVIRGDAACFSQSQRSPPGRRLSIESKKYSCMSDCVCILSFPRIHSRHREKQMFLLCFFSARRPRREQSPTCWRVSDLGAHSSASRTRHPAALRKTKMVQTGPVGGVAFSGKAFERWIFFFCLFQSSITLIFTSLLSDSGAETSHNYNIWIKTAMLCFISPRLEAKLGWFSEWFHTHSNLKEKVSDGGAVRDSQARGIHFVCFFY